MRVAQTLAGCCWVGGRPERRLDCACALRTERTSQFCPGPSQPESDSLTVSSLSPPSAAPVSHSVQKREREREKIRLRTPERVMRAVG